MNVLVVVGVVAWLLAALLAYGLARAAARNELAPRGGPRVIGRDVYLDPMGEDRRP